MDGIDPEESDQHGPDTLEASIIAGLTFIGGFILVALDKLRDWIWEVLHGE